MITAAEQVAEIEVRGWDVAQKRKIVSSVPAGTKSVDLPTMKPADMAKPFGDPNYVASDVAVPKPVRGRHRSNRPGGRDRQLVRRNRRCRAGETRNCGPMSASSIENAGEPFDGKYTITAARHRYDPTHGGYTTAFSVTGRQERSLYGLTAGGGRVGPG